MKHHNKNDKGFSTVEMMIALAIMTIVLSAVVVVAFGNQFALIGSQTNAEAINLAQELLEQEQAQARKDFNLVNSVAASTTDIYQTSVTSRLLSDYLTKEVTANISWRNERGSTSTLDLSTLIANFDAPIGGNTCDSSLVGDWQHPAVENATTDFATLIGDASGTYTLSDIDAYKGNLYVTASSVSGNTTPTFFVFSIANPASPALLGKIDNEGSGGTASTGLSAVRVAEDPVTANTYAFLATASNSNYSTCNPVTNKNCGQLDIINVTSPQTSGWTPQMTNLMIASSTAPFVKGSQAQGTSIFYRNGYILLGLAATGSGNGPEFHIIDVHVLSNLFLASAKNIVYPVGSFAVGNAVNAIAMRGTYAYLATANGQQLKVLNISNPASLVSSGSYTSGSGNGKGISIVGNNLYLAKTTGSGDDFHIVDISNPATTLSSIGGVDAGTSVDDVIQRDYLSFMVTNSSVTNELRIYRTDNLASIIPWGTLSLGTGSVSPTPEPAMDCELNRMYITSNDGTGRGKLFVVKPS